MLWGLPMTRVGKTGPTVFPIGLGCNVIDAYRPARLDPALPIEDTVGAIADLVKAGYVRHVGLSEVGVDTDIAPVETLPPRDALEGTRYPAGAMKQLDSER